MRLVFVHGMAQQGKTSASLLEIWKAGLEVGLSEAGLKSLAHHEMVLPFYGDTLAQLVERVRAEDPSPGRARGAPPDRHVDLFEAALARDLLPETFNGGLDSSVTEKGLQNTRAAHLLAKLADASAWGPSILKWIGEVAVYLNNATAQQEVDRIVADAIPASQPCVVVGHSLGSVVAYRVLRRLAETAQVARFITLGSPLGLNTVRRTLRPLEVPAGVKSWLNVYDARDIVALHPLDQTTWDVHPMIANMAMEQNHTDNRHGISGYLDCPEVAVAIHDALEGCRG
jgi:pimeloyl-ACP methyl ester carboxylesterase